jgi:hypothetical protein
MNRLTSSYLKAWTRAYKESHRRLWGA